MRSNLWFLVPCLLSACHPSAVKVEGEVFRYNEATGIQSLDPIHSRDQASNWANAQLYSTLVRTDSLLNIEGDLATSWATSQDGLTMSFTLRHDAYFHDAPCFPNALGRAVTAEDLVYSLNRVRDPLSGSSGTWVLSPVDSIWAPREDSLVITLHYPDQTRLGRLAMPYCSAVPHEAVESSDNFGETPVGSGPFYLKAWHRGEKMVMRKHVRYHLVDDQGVRLPYLEAVSIRFIPDRQTAFLEMVKGDLDFLTGLDPSYKDQLLDLEGNLAARWEGEMTLEKAPFLNTEYLGIQMDPCTPDFLCNASVRRALNIAIDRESMIQHLKNGVGAPGNRGVIPKGMPGFVEQDRPLPYAPEYAQELLKEALGEDLSQLDPIVISTTASYRDLCSYIQSAWIDLGLKVELEVLPSATFREEKAQGQLAVYRASWIADYPDPENYLMLFESSQHAPAGPNAAHVSDIVIDGFLDVSRTLRGDARLDLLQEADHRIRQQDYIVPLMYDESVRVLRQGWLGLPPHPMNALDLRRVRRVRD